MEPPDRHYVLAAEGWLELGNLAEAVREWEGLSSEGRVHPAALQVRWHILAHGEAWDEALRVAEDLVRRAPEVCAGWLHRAYAMRRCSGGGLQQAWEVLHPAADRFPEEEIVAYNLACYATQLGREDEGWEWFLRASQVSRNAGRLRVMALRDADLQPLWERIRGMR